jgi:glutaredoxin 3
MDIKIYTTPTCTWCIKLKEWLKKKKVSFQDLEVTESDTWRDELIEKSAQMATPVIDIDGEIIIGFDEKKLEAAINKAN